ncbi:MAG TPA: tetratricopeptide repeat protein [Spirochaetia bacterium]|nr:tetratricopeptide repeat protein [Spirochaetia bacterium]
MTRAEAIDRIHEAGGKHAREPGPSTSILVAGNAQGHLTADGEISHTMAVFRELKKTGAGIRLVDEIEFLRLLGAEDDLEDFSRLYTAEQVSRIVEAPLPKVRSWVRKGLLQPARVTNRLAWFEFKDIVNACNLSRLTTSGVPASQIHKSLSEIARWLPDGERILSRLESYATGLRLRLPDGSWVEPSGQRLMDFQPADVRSVPYVSKFADGGPGLFSRAVEAEEQGDLEAAARLYAHSVEATPEPEAFFNLGNVLYDLGREATAAERYLQAIEADHNFAEAWNNLGNSLAALGKLSDAVHAYEMALSLEPDYPEPHCNLVTVLDKLGQFEKALVHRAICQKAFPSAAHLTLLRNPSSDGAED